VKFDACAVKDLTVGYLNRL